MEIGKEPSVAGLAHLESRIRNALALPRRGYQSTFTNAVNALNELLAYVAVVNLKANEFYAHERDDLIRHIAERDETIRQLRDPVAVHIAMLRGEIAVPPLAELLHVYGATFSDLDAANIEIAKARAEAAKWERLHDELYAEIASEHRRDEYGETEAAAECIRRIIRERDQLRAQLDEYEREKLKRESQEPVAFRWLGPGKGWRPVYAEPPVPRVDPDWLANVIRRADPRMSMTSDELAEKIAEAINGRAK